jgi:hypothetical protein
MYGKVKPRIAMNQIITFPSSAFFRPTTSTWLSGNVGRSIASLATTTSTVGEGLAMAPNLVKGLRSRSAQRMNQRQLSTAPGSEHTRPGVCVCL